MCILMKCVVFFFKQKTAYEMRISDWSSDVCSSDLDAGKGFAVVANEVRALAQRSADAAKDIKELIGTSSGQVTSGVELVGRTGQTLDHIVMRNSEVLPLVTEISATTESQAANLQKVKTQVCDMIRRPQNNAHRKKETRSEK